MCILPAVRLDRVTRTFGGHELVTPIKNFDLVLAPGEIAALTGPSGSGKSTLLNLIAGFDAPDTGRVFLGDLDLASIAPAELDRLRGGRVGFVFQLFELIPACPRSRTSSWRCSRPARLGPNDGGGLGRRWRGWDWRGWSIVARRNCRAGSSSAWRSPVHWSPSPPYCSLTSPPPRSIAPTPTGCSRKCALAAERDMAVLMSSHDPRCLDAADRVIRLDQRKAA